MYDIYYQVSRIYVHGNYYKGKNSLYVSISYVSINCMSWRPLKTHKQWLWQDAFS